MMMEEDKSIPPIVFDSHTFYFSNNCQDELSLHFYEEAEGLCFTCSQTLKRINMKTVKAGLSKSDQKAVAAQLIRQGIKQYHLQIQVHEEFLMPIEETLLFTARELNKNQLDKISFRRQGKIRLNRLKEEIIEVQGQCFESGAKTAENGCIILTLPIPYQTTLYTLTLEFKKLEENIVFFDFYCLDGKRRTEIDVMPKEGVYTLGNIDSCHLIKRKNFKELIISIKGNFDELKYLVKYERVEEYQSFVNKIVKNKIKIGVAALAMLMLFTFFFSGDAQPL